MRINSYAWSDIKCAMEFITSYGQKIVKGMINKRLLAGLLVLPLVFSAGYLQFRKEKRFTRTFPIHFSPKYHPYIKTSINSITDHFVLDTGGSFFCQLDEKAAPLFDHAQFHRTLKSIDIHSGIFEEDEFFLENVNFLGINFSRLYLLKGEDNLFERGILSTSPTDFEKNTEVEDYAGALIGHKLLSNFDVYFDFPNKKLAIYNTGLNPLFHFPYRFLLSTKKIPIDYLDHAGVICEVQTEHGSKKFLIDTGCPSTLVKGEPNKNEILNTFVIGSKNYGPIQAVSTPLTLFKDFDGIIGMDLLYDKSLYIDFENKFICLE